MKSKIPTWPSELSKTTGLAIRELLRLSQIADARKRSELPSILTSIAKAREGVEIDRRIMHEAVQGTGETANSVEVTLPVQAFTRKMLQEAARINNCTVQKAAQYLVNLSPEYLAVEVCDWSNNGYAVQKS